MVRQRLEKHIEQAVVDWATQNGWLVRKLQWVGRTGAPDRIFIGFGRVVFMEFKRTGNKITGQQKKEFERICEVYAFTFLIDDVDEGIKALKECMR